MRWTGASGRRSGSGRVLPDSKEKNIEKGESLTDFLGVGVTWSDLVLPVIMCNPSPLHRAQRDTASFEHHNAPVPSRPINDYIIDI